MVSSARISNYKSLGAAHNELVIGRGLTAIIGKNESGKTNIAEALAELDFSRQPFRIENADKKLNRLMEGGEICVSVTFNGAKFGQSQIVARSNSISVYGGIVDAVFDDARVIAALEVLEAQRGFVGFKERFCQNPYAALNEVSSLLEREQEKKLGREDGLNAGEGSVAGDGLEAGGGRVAGEGCDGLRQDFGRDERIVSLLFDFRKCLCEYVFEMPYIFCAGSDGKNSFREYYFLDELKNLAADDIFFKLVRVAGMSIAGAGDSVSDFAGKNAGGGVFGFGGFAGGGAGCGGVGCGGSAGSAGDSADSVGGAGGGFDFAGIFEQRRGLARQMLLAGLERVAAGFSRVLGREFRLGFEIRLGRLYLTCGNGVMLDELPISLRWYFALYVDILFRDIKNGRILFVFDSPGLYMHINAQKELLKIFGSIVKRGHQILYTTHSPFLLDIGEIACMRAVEKRGGITRIYNKIYAGEVSRGSKMETLTPIFEALGVSFSPQLNGRDDLNIIVEGISDYYYLKAMLYYFFGEAEDMPYILPSVGASNIANVAAILIGWGIRFKAIVDCDEEGKKAADKMAAKQGLRLGEDIFFVNGEAVYRAGDEFRVENLLASADKAKLTKPRTKQSKAILSRAFYDGIKSGKITPEKETKQNFEKLFKAMKLI